MAEAPKRFKKRDDKFGAARRRRTCSFCGDKRGSILARSEMKRRSRFTSL